MVEENSQWGYQSVCRDENNTFNGKQRELEKGSIALWKVLCTCWYCLIGICHLDAFSKTFGDGMEFCTYSLNK